MNIYYSNDLQSGIVFFDVVSHMIDEFKNSTQTIPNHYKHLELLELCSENLQ